MTNSNANKNLRMARESCERGMLKFVFENQNHVLFEKHKMSVSKATVEHVY
jgi:hypothetical protein